MSSLIRREDVERAAPVAPWRPSVPTADDPPAIDPAILAREERIRVLEARIEEIKREHDAALDRARAAAAKEAADRLKRDEAEALALLGANVAGAASKLEEAIAALERLAPLMCETALATVFDDASMHHAHVAAAIDRQMRALNGDSVIVISVSSEDFSGEEALPALASKYKGVSITPDAALPRGACKMTLRLGTIDIDLPAHWRALQQRLAEMAGLT